MRTFIVIQGTYHLVGRTGAARPSGFEPDGDSIHFKPANPALLDRLIRLRRAYALTVIGSLQLRFEGLDALEMHFQPEGGGQTHQPRPAADQPRDTHAKQETACHHKSQARHRTAYPQSRHATTNVSRETTHANHEPS